MPVNIGFTFLFGEILGWTIVNILKPKSYLEGLIVASSAKLEKPSSNNHPNHFLLISYLSTIKLTKPKRSRGKRI